MVWLGGTNVAVRVRRINENFEVFGRNFAIRGHKMAEKKEPVAGGGGG